MATVILAAAFAAVLSAAVIRATLPALLRHAMAQPNHRSSHKIPTPQGAGIAVILATLVVSIAAILWKFATPEASLVVPIFVSAAALAITGAIDDLRPIPVAPRLALQSAAVGFAIWSMTWPTTGGMAAQGTIFTSLPWAAEYALLLLAGIWFVNLVNFMDGLDWMTVAEAVPVTAAIVLLNVFNGTLSPFTVIAAALCGALIGFAPFNRPVAKVFLGDVGSLPIGLLLGCCLLHLAQNNNQIVAALLLPLYYIADATLTLLLRLARGERIWDAHRSHFYQRATSNGFSVKQVVAEVFLLNIGLAMLSALTIAVTSAAARGMIFCIGLAAVAFVLHRFSRQRRPSLDPA